MWAPNVLLIQTVLVSPHIINGTWSFILKSYLKHCNILDKWRNGGSFCFKRENRIENVDLPQHVSGGIKIFVIIKLRKKKTHPLYLKLKSLEQLQLWFGFIFFFFLKSALTYVVCKKHSNTIWWWNSRNSMWTMKPCTISCQRVSLWTMTQFCLYF